MFLPGECQGRGSLVGCSPWGREESDTAERLHFHFTFFTTCATWAGLDGRYPGLGIRGGGLAGCGWGVSCVREGWWAHSLKGTPSGAGAGAGAGEGQEAVILDLNPH